VSALPWFRVYHRMVDDERLRLLAFEDRWHFVALLCLKAEGMIDGEKNDLWERRLAVKMGLQTRELEELQRRLMGVGLIDADWQPCKWDELQQRSDSSAERVRKYREKRKANGMAASGSGYQRHYQALMQRDGGACVYCRSTDNLCIDHMVTIVQGGTDDIDNLAIACKRCNSGKSGRTPEQARYKIVWEQAAVALSRYVTVTVTPQIREDKIREEVEPKGSCASGDAPAFTVDDFVEAWNDTAKTCGLSQIRKLTDARRRAFTVRRREYPEIADWQSAFRCLQSNKWMHGDNRNGWRADPDFFLQAKSFTKLVEGQYAQADRP
jgi:hypothetical protein